jgi:hypothetical protein
MTEFDPTIARLFDRPQIEAAPEGLASSILAAIDRRDRQRGTILGAAAVAGGAATAAAGAAAGPGLLAMLPALPTASIMLAVAVIVAIAAVGVMAGTRLLQSSAI